MQTEIVPGNVRSRRLIAVLEAELAVLDDALAEASTPDPHTAHPVCPDFGDVLDAQTRTDRARIPEIREGFRPVGRARTPTLLGAGVPRRA